MNDRIRELSEQAQLYARQGMGKCVIELQRFDADAISERYTKDFEDKFAELIVAECIKLNGKELAMPGHSRMVDVYCDHFGIKF